MPPTRRPWGINGKTNAGWRIDSLVPREGKTGLEFMLHPIAIVPKREDADLIVGIVNTFAQEDPDDGN